MIREMNPPRVSLGLPVFNGERYLEAAIDSILAQTLRDFELILSDNGSTDSTPAICQRYSDADSRIIFHRSETNRGGAWNFNFVFHESRGQYFKWACHDDLMAPTYLENCVDILDRNPDVVLCYPKTLMIDSEGSRKASYNDGFHLVSPSPSKRFEQVLFREMRRCNPVLGLIRREALAGTNLIGTFMASDEILLAELALVGKYYEFPEELAMRRDHAETSVRANPTISERYLWFDPSIRSRFLLPTLRHFVEYMRCIKRSPISTREKWHCCCLAFRLFRWNRKIFWNEIKTAVR
jgi:glycosyltransferase involved in cell wall biosynthesis